MSGPRLDEFARPGDAWSRAYLGSDFCQTLLPAPSTMLEAFAALRGRAAFALVTPPVNDAGLHRVGVLLDLLAAETAPEAATEVVVNDWGVLGLVRAHPSLTPVLGRLLTRMLRDPRLPPDRLEAEAPSTRALQQSSVTSPPFQGLLRSFGVRRVELDPVAQGLAMDFDAMGLAPTLHAPFGYVTTGRVCLFAAMGQAEEHRFEVGAPCRQECRRFAARMTDAAPSPDAALITAGNTVMQRHERSVITRVLDALASRDARVVVRDAPFGEVAWATEHLPSATRWIEEHVS